MQGNYNLYINSPRYIKENRLNHKLNNERFLR